MTFFRRWDGRWGSVTGLRSFTSLQPNEDVRHGTN